MSTKTTSPPGQAIATVGFGHLVPLDDLLQTEYGTLTPESYTRIDPQNETANLPMPRPEGNKIETSASVDVLSGDLGLAGLP